MSKSRNMTLVLARWADVIWGRNKRRGVNNLGSPKDYTTGKKVSIFKTKLCRSTEILGCIFFLYNYQVRLKGNIPNSLEQKVLKSFYLEYTEATCKVFQGTTSKKIFLQLTKGSHSVKGISVGPTLWKAHGFHKNLNNAAAEENLFVSAVPKIHHVAWKRKVGNVAPSPGRPPFGLQMLTLLGRESK